MPLELDLFAFDRGSVTAPAGCGKTRLIADSVGGYGGIRPILILTHTNAGAAALRERLKQAHVSNGAFRVSTLDGLSMRLIGMFPSRSRIDPRILDISDPQNDYPAIRIGVLNLLQGGHITTVLRATYSRVIVDEYQDCGVTQHAMVNALAEVLPTVVLGDPLQAIFGFGGTQLVHWQLHVEATFPARGRLETPWRWRNAGTEPLGRWLLEVREHLTAGRGVDLRAAPPEIEWIATNDANAIQQRRAAAQTRLIGQEQTVLVIGDSRNPRGRHQLTSTTPGATVIEAVDMRDLVSFARQFNPVDADSLDRLVGFAGEVMTHVDGTNLLARVRTIRAGRSRTAPTPAETAAVAYATVPSIGAALLLLERLEEQANARVYRPEMLYCCRTAFKMTASGKTPFLNAVVQARERNRHFGRVASRRSVGSTLLLKGLEADVAVVLHPELMDAPNLYVALTRGARRVVVCSNGPLVSPLR